jgi:hypothetical protein
MRFISTLLIIYLIWQVIKFVFKLWLRYWIKKNAGKGFQYSAGFGGAGQQAPRPEGEIRVDTFSQPKTQQSKPSIEDLGEYVDYEEVK